jgi:hypothetical protein
MDVVYESGVDDWPTERFEHLLHLKERALNVAKERQVDYVLVWVLPFVMTDRSILMKAINSVCHKRPIMFPTRLL